MQHSIKNWSNALLVGGAVTALLVSSLAFGDTVNNLFPSSDGTNTAWTPNAGTTHYTQVDESTCNGNTDYVSTATVGNRDSYGISLGSIPDGSTITQVDIKPCASRNSGGGGGSATMNVFYRWGTTTSSDAGSYALSGTTPAVLATTTFSGLNLAKGSTSTLQVGAIYSAGTKGARLSQVRVRITYTPPPPPAPSVTTNAASGISTTSSVLNGSANPNGYSSTGWFRYSSTNPGSCSDSFGTRAPASGGTALGSGTSSVNYSQTVTGLSSNTTYYFCAIASSTGGTAFGSVLSFTTLNTVPSAPSGLSAINISGSQNDLSWTDNSSNEDGFKIERSTSSFSGFVQIATTSANATSYSDSTGLSGDTMYYYRVRAYNSGGNSSYSNTASAFTYATTPAAPTNLVARASSSAPTITLTWTDNSNNEQYFEIERGLDGISFSLIATSSVGFYQNSGLATSTLYYYQVRAINPIGNSAYSNVASTSTNP